MLKYESFKITTFNFPVATSRDTVVKSPSTCAEACLNVSSLSQLVLCEIAMQQTKAGRESLLCLKLPLIPHS